MSGAMLRDGRPCGRRSLVAEVEREPGLAPRLRELRRCRDPRPCRSPVVAWKRFESPYGSLFPSGDVVERRRVRRRIRRDRVEERADEADAVRGRRVAWHVGDSLTSASMRRPDRGRRRGAADRVPAAVRGSLKTVIPPVNSSASRADVGQLAAGGLGSADGVVGRAERVAGLAEVVRLDGVRGRESLEALAPPGTSERCCQAGIGQDSEMPPPAAPPTGPSFQTCSKAGWVALSIVVPPTATTYGWLEGSSDGQDRADRRRRPEGVAVVAALVPGGREDGLALGRRLLEDDVLGLLDAGRALLRAPCSQNPQLVVTIWSTSSLTILAYSSSEPKVVFGAS